MQVVAIQVVALNLSETQRRMYVLSQKVIFMPVIQIRRTQPGFSLIELVIGITTFAIAITIITGVLAPQINRTVDPIYQVRATELAQSMFNEILSKYYDENSDRSGGRIRCNEDLNGDGDADDKNIGEELCSENLGPENPGENDRSDFDDVDDYEGYYEDEIIQNSLAEDLIIDGVELYNGFAVEVSVFYDNDQDQVPNDLEAEVDQHGTGNIKHILLTVTTPSGDELTFSSFKHNY